MCCEKCVPNVVGMPIISYAQARARRSHLVRSCNMYEMRDAQTQGYMLCVCFLGIPIIGIRDANKYTLVCVGNCATAKLFYFSANIAAHSFAVLRCVFVVRAWSNWPLTRLDGSLFLM